MNGLLLKITNQLGITTLSYIIKDPDFINCKLYFACPAGGVGCNVSGEVTTQNMPSYIGEPSRINRT
jgi:hypothetical protein